MPNYTISPNMDLPIPVVGQEPGPTYATDINNCLTLVDQHNHEPGSGVQITPDGMNINSSLDFQSNLGTNIAGLGLVVQASSPGLSMIHQQGSDLYFTDAVGNDVRITQSGAVAGTPGSISNLTSPASAAYVSSNATFVWESGVNIAANMDMGSAVLRNLTLSSFGLTLSPPTLANDYTITLPTLPASTSIVEIDNSGTMTATQTLATLMPTGAVMAYAGTSAPTGWLMCDGSAVSRATYAALFAVIGITAGQGNGSTTFNVPDYRGRFLRGVDGAAGRDPDAAGRTAMNTGGNTGNNVNSVQDDALEYHNHGVTDPGHNHTQAIANGVGGGFTSALVAGAYSGQTPDAWSTYNNTTGITINNSGSSTENRPLNAYVAYIIRV